jgi:hypothetical protein
MESDLSVHDNIVYAYCFDCEGRRLVVHTAFQDRTPHEFTDIVFDGVIAHQFQNELRGSILFDVEEIELNAMVSDNAELFRESWRYGWPPVEYKGDLNTLATALRAASVRAYLIDSSYGLSGWVLAASAKRVARSEKATIT